ncbi:MAG: hypothetical protein NT167_21480, partial [Verrucomicrobia bacterium]|nr:hypothetical protein [Verrucomicrobiota bacterium]
SESLAEYSALQTLKKAYGEAALARFLKVDMDRYLQGRGSEREDENPLVAVQNQQYIHYSKGAIAFCALADRIGEEKLNAALAGFVKKTAFQEPPYTTSLELMGLITLATLAAALLCGFPAAAAGSDGTILTGAGWTIEARGDGGRITIRHERLGTILSGVRLNLEAGGALQELKRWTAGATCVHDAAPGTGPDPAGPRLFILNRKACVRACGWFPTPTRARLKPTLTGICATSRAV